MDFVFKKTPDKKSLQQGDLLLKTPALARALSEAHDYYAQAADYTHFLILTQSCELVRRNGKPKARYITVAAVRPLSAVIGRFLEKYKFKDTNFPIPLCDAQNQILAEQFLERLLHNTQEGYFFLRKDSSPSIGEDLCVFLMLSVALKIDHYDACLDAKVAQLDDIFAAKVGWLSGNLYSRIATPDIEERVSDPDKYKESFYEEVLFNKTVWLTPAQLRELKKRTSIWQRENPSQTLDENMAKDLIKDLPQSINLISQRILEILMQGKIIANDSGSLNAARKLIENDRSLERLIKSYC